MVKPWAWLPRLPGAVARENRAVLRAAVRSRAVFWAVTRSELQKRYAGSLLGPAWHVLYAVLLLGMFSFIYMGVMRGGRGELSGLAYVVFIFCGLVPYLGISEAVSVAASSVKSNIGLIKNTVFPVELIPVKHLAVSLTGLGVSLALLLALALLAGTAGWHWLYLPVPVVLIVLFSLAAVWFVSALAAMVPDVQHVVGLVLLFALFVSPVGYRLHEVGGTPRALALMNPLTYLIESTRFAVMGPGLASRGTPLWADAVFGVACAGGVSLSAAWFRRLMPMFSDLE